MISLKFKNLISIFKEKGGFKLVKQYKKSGVLVFALLEGMILGKSRTSLEILRLAIQNRVQQKLSHRYKSEILKLESKYKEFESTDPSIMGTSNVVWFCWLQGVQNAPEIVRLCYRKLKKAANGHRIVTITSDNFQDYVKIPEYILIKWRNKQISNTHFSDILRAGLLAKHGGIWVDATVLVTTSKLPSYFDDDLFFYQSLKPGKEGKALFISSWVLCSHQNNPIILMTRDLLYNYWEKNNFLQDYFLFHHFFCIACKVFPKTYSNVLPIDSALPHKLLLNLFEPYDKKKFDLYLSESPIHKLSYKFKEESISKNNTIYVKLLKELQKK